MSSVISDLAIHRFRTCYGKMAVVWGYKSSRPRIHLILLPKTAQSQSKYSTGIKDGTCPAVSALAREIVGFLSGRAVSFDLSQLRLDLCRPFQRKVLLAEACIPRGRVSTYGRIARHIGSPNASRAVGTALARNPFPIVIPCHRALRSDLSLGGYQGGLSMKRRLLEMEGICFDRLGRAEVDSLFY